VKNRNLYAALWLILLGAFVFSMASLSGPDARAADTVTAYTARADGQIVEGQFVKITAEGNAKAASAASDAILGVAESNALNTGAFRYAAPGTRTRVGTRASVTAGQMLTAGLSGYAEPVNTDANTAQTIAAVALTTRVDGNATYHPKVDCIVLKAGGVALKPGGVELLTKDTEPGIPFIVWADANRDISWIVPAGKALKVIDVWTVQDDASSDANNTVVVKNGNNALCGALALDNADNGVERAATIIEAYDKVAAGTNLTVDVTLVDVTQVKVYIMCCWVTP